MIKIILIIVYAVAFCMSAIIFLFYGRKKGLRGGLTVVISSAAAFVASCFLSPVVAVELSEIQPVQQFVRNAVDIAAEYEIDSASFINILSDAVLRILKIPAAIVLYILFFIVAFVITRTVMRFIVPKNSEADKTSRLIGAVLSAASPIIVAVLTLFVSEIKLFDEAESIDSIMSLTSKPVNEIASQLCGNPDSYTKILFETTITDADENQRLELVNDSINALVLNSNDELLCECFDFDGYSCRGEFEADVKTVSELYNIFEDMDLFGEDDFAQKLLAVQDKDEMSQKLYQLSFKDYLVRYIISYSVRELTDSDDFIYPKDVQILGTYEDFAALITTAEKFENGEISQLDLLSELKESPLLPTELYAKLIFMNSVN